MTLKGESNKGNWPFACLSTPKLLLKEMKIVCHNVTRHTLAICKVDYQSPHKTSTWLVLRKHLMPVWKLEIINPLASMFSIQQSITVPPNGIPSYRNCLACIRARRQNILSSLQKFLALQLFHCKLLSLSWHFQAKVGNRNYTRENPSWVIIKVNWDDDCRKCLICFKIKTLKHRRKELSIKTRLQLYLTWTLAQRVTNVSPSCYETELVFWASVSFAKIEPLNIFGKRCLNVA